MSKIKFAVTEWAFPMFGAPAIRMAAEAGFQGVQLADAGAFMLGYPLNDKRVQDYYLNAGAKYGIEFPQIHLYTNGHFHWYRNAADSREGEISRENVIKACQAASEMGVGSVIIDCMKLLNPAKYAHALEYAKFAVKVGAEYGVNIGMECDFQMQEHIDFLDEVGGNLRLCFDTHNPCLYGTGYPPEMVKILGPDRIDHYHIKDNKGDKNGFVSYETPLAPFGTGVACFDEVAKAIKEIGYEGWVVSENMYHQPEVRRGLNAIEAAKRDVEALHRAFD